MTRRPSLLAEKPARSVSRYDDFTWFDGHSKLPPRTTRDALETSPDFTIRAWLPGIILFILPLVIYRDVFADTTINLDIELGVGETKYTGSGLRTGISRSFRQKLRSWN